MKIFRKLQGADREVDLLVTSEGKTTYSYKTAMYEALGSTQMTLTRGEFQVVLDRQELRQIKSMLDALVTI